MIILNCQKNKKFLLRGIEESYTSESYHTCESNTERSQDTDAENVCKSGCKSKNLSITSPVSR